MSGIFRKSVEYSHNSFVDKQVFCTFAAVLQSISNFNNPFMMNSITFTCETITPMFLSGADGTTPELRAPSIKGALRFWWRAMNGHLAKQKDGEWDHTSLLKEDEKLFGGINTQTKSSILVRISNRNEKPLNATKLLKYAEHDKSNKKVPYKQEGLAYLYYVLLNQKLDGLNGFDIGTTFEITLSGENSQDLLKATAAFWLFVYLGSIGSRARRGAGAIRVDKIEDKDDILNGLLSFTPQSDMNIFIKDNLAQIKAIFPNSNNLPLSTGYSTVAPNHIYISPQNGFGTWQEALNDIGLTMKNLRKAKPHWDRTRRKFTMDTLDQKAAFGLPIKLQEDNELNFVNGDYSRRASPIYISIVKNAKNCFNWVVVHFQGNFMPSNSSLIFESKNSKMTYPKRIYPFSQENPILLNNFIREITLKSLTIEY